jgi:uncharacterized protein (TIGR01777 family)
VTRLVRSQPRPSAAEIQWDPEKGVHDLSGLEGVDAVVHLAGENIASGRWTAERKARIRDSRVNGTRALCEALVRLSRPPKVLVSASATGYYGNRGTELLTEESPAGQGFLAEVCQAWEEATAPAVQAGIRVVPLRIGLVLSPRGGVLAKIRWPFASGLGGPVGSGEQYMSWIALDDVVGAIHHVLLHETLRGPINGVAPHPVTNKEFVTTLGRILKRPTFLPLPAAALRFALGEMAEELLLSSTRVEPRRLVESHYTFRYPQLEGALRSLLGRP